MPENPISPPPPLPLDQASPLQGPAPEGADTQGSIDGTTQFTHETQGPPPDGSALPGAGQPLPQMLGPYHIEGPLGEGGMGQVLAAWDPRLSRRVAIKRVRGLGASPQGRARLWREARSLAALKHPGIVTVYDIGEDDGGDLYIAMELVEGWPLSRLTRLPWSPALVLWMMEAIARALGACHKVGIVHRDIKPSNILIEEGGQPKVVDFGLARGEEENAVTETGAILGTPAYMAPEQVEGEETSPRTDTFALGILLYRLLAGVHPFKRERKRETAMAIVAGRFTPLSERCPELPPPLLDLARQCLSLDAASRPEDGIALADALASISQTQGWRHTPRDLATFAAPIPQQRTQGPQSPSPRPSQGAPPKLPRPATLPGEAPLPTPSPLSQGTLAPRPDHPRKISLKWLALGVGGLALALGLGLGSGESPFTGGGNGGGDIPLQSVMGSSGGSVLSTLPPTLAQALPRRPVIAFLGVKSDGLSEEERLSGRVLGESLTLRLSDAPDALISAPEAVVRLSGLKGDPAAPTTDLSPLTRAGRSLGHIDLGLRGEVNAKGALRVEVVEIRSGEILGTLILADVWGDPIAGGIALGEALGLALGIDLGKANTRYKSSFEAWGATLLARDAAYRGDLQGTREDLEWATRLEPDFPQARLLELAVFRGERRMDDLKEGAQALLDGQRLGPMDRAYAQAWLSFGEGDSETSTRQLYALLERWPYHVEAYDLLMGQLSFIEAVKDHLETARLAKRMLRLTPHNEEPATRLIRALNAQGQVDEAADILAEVGFPHGPEYGEVWGDLAFYGGDFKASIPLYLGAISSQEESLYASHMIMSAQILEGRCEEAAQSALDRIHRVTRTGVDSNLDWTYSLTAQSLACLGRFEAMGEVLDEWSKHSESGRQQVAVWQPKLMDLMGASREEVEGAILESLAQDGLDDEHRPEQLLSLARWGRDLSTLESMRQAAATESLRKSTMPSGRRRYRLANQALEGRIRLMEGALDEGLQALGAKGLVDAALEEPAAYVVGDQWELERAFIAASFLKESGREAEAKGLFDVIANAGVERLWRTDLWYIATHQGGAND